MNKPILELDRLVAAKSKITRKNDELNSDFSTY